jgi:hypothetical protein
MVGNQRGEPISNSASPIGQREQHHTAIRRQSATIERSCDFLARNGWQVEASAAKPATAATSAPRRSCSTTCCHFLDLGRTPSRM